MALRRVPRPGASAGRDTDASGSEGGDGPADLTRVFADEVSWYMSEHKVTRADLAQAMGVSPGRVSQTLSGDENLTLRTISGVLAALGAELEVILHPVDGPAE
jgi:hypothetical protein